MNDIVTVGHLTLDTIHLPTRRTPFTVLGGSTTYVSLIGRHLDAKTAIITKVGSDFPAAYTWWLRQEGVELTGLVTEENAKTTRFELRYNDDLSDRLLRLTSKAPQITSKDIPDALKGRAIHIAPIANEISYEAISKLRDHADILSIDPQGLLRDFDQNGNVALEARIDKRVLSFIDIYKSSVKEIQTLTGQSDLNQATKTVHEYGPKIVIVTLGKIGVTVSIENSIHKVPAYPPDILVDPTGAGDTYIGAFLTEYIRGEDCSWCAHVASAAASLTVEGIGPTALGGKDEIYRRAHDLYQKEIKLDAYSNAANRQIDERRQFGPN